jgi:hypothetical protein
MKLNSFLSDDQLRGYGIRRFRHHHHHHHHKSPLLDSIRNHFNIAHIFTCCFRLMQSPIHVTLISLRDVSQNCRCRSCKEIIKGVMFSDFKDQMGDGVKCVRLRVTQTAEPARTAHIRV